MEERVEKEKLKRKLQMEASQHQAAVKVGSHVCLNLTKYDACSFTFHSLQQLQANEIILFTVKLELINKYLICVSVSDSMLVERCHG